MGINNRQIHKGRMPTETQIETGLNFICLKFLIYERKLAVFQPGGRQNRDQYMRIGIIGLLICLPAFFILMPTDALTVRAAEDIGLSEEEKEWLSKHKIFRLGVGVAFPPFQYVEKVDGEYRFQGMVSDYVRLLEKRLGVSMEVVFGISFKEALEMGRKREIDIFPCVAHTPERSEFLNFTKPYLSYPLVILTRTKAPFIGSVEGINGRRISIVKALATYSKMQNDYPHLNANYVFRENVSQVLEAVSLGEADVCIVNLAVASYYIQRGFTNVKVAAPTSWRNNNLSIGVRNDWPILLRIMEKALASISLEEKDKIKQRWIAVRYEHGIKSGDIWKWSIIIGSIILLAMAVIFAWNRSLQKEIKTRKEAEAAREELIKELRTALDEVKTLQGFIPICANCHKIRDDAGYWQKVEQYIQDRTEATFSHSICPDCVSELYPEIDIESEHSAADKKG